MAQALIGVVLAGFLATLCFGLATRRIAWRQQGCCPADPAQDLRMRDPAHATTQHHTAQPDA
jgi:hypothetical protein